MDYPKYFLGDTAEEAEETHNRFVIVLNKIAENYSVYTGIDKGDLFNEGLFGLAEAVKKFDSNRSDNFYNFALFKIKDKINNYTRKYEGHVSIPKYLNQAIILFNKITRLLEGVGIETDYVSFIAEGEYYYSTEIEETDVSKIESCVRKLSNIAERSNTTLYKLLKRIEFIPQPEPDLCIESVGYKDISQEEKDIKEVVSKLGEEEFLISKYLMEGYTQSEIASKMNRSSSWVSGRIKKIRRKIENKNG